MQAINILFEQALAAHQADDFPTAQKLYRAILGREPQHAQSLHMLGLLAAQLGQFNNAIALFEQALKFQSDDPILHNNLANALKRVQQYERAQQSYARAIQLDAEYADAYNNLGSLLFKQRLYEAAATQFQTAIDLQPDYFEAHLNLGLLAIQRADNSNALLCFETALALNPNSTIALQQAASLYLQQDALTKAEQHYQRLLGLQPCQLEALNNLGVLELKRKNSAAALEYFHKVLQIEPKHPDARNNLAGALLQLERFTEAIWHYRLYLQLVPDDYATHYTLGVACMAAGLNTDAIEQFNRVIAQLPTHAAAYCNLGALYLKMEKLALAIEHYQRAWQLQPSDQSIQYILSALTGSANPAAAPPDYVKNLFDSYAGHFEQHLSVALHYQVPMLLQQALATHLALQTEWRVLDLGCGSGLAGQALQPWATYLAGIDVSPRMLQKAAEKNIYAELIEADILMALANLATEFDLIIAADTLVYFGELRALFEAVQRRLTAGGLFAFTVETGAVTPYQLMPTARYQHAEYYIESLAVQFNLQITTTEKINGRLQAGEPVPGHLFILKK